MKTVFKVTRLDGTSRIAWGPLEVKYAIGRKTYPTIGYLFAFDNIEDAKTFLANLGSGIIFECKAKIAEINIRHIPLYDNDVGEFWELINSDIKYTKTLVNFPTGTVFVNTSFQ